VVLFDRARFPEPAGERGGDASTGGGWILTISLASSSRPFLFRITRHLELAEIVQ
jgi:hypothetical protein